MSSLNADGQIITTNGAIVTCVGKKRSGKTVLALCLAQSFPGDIVVIDVAQDDGPKGPGVVEWRGTVDDLPRRFPSERRRREGERLILRYTPDAGSATYREDMDAVVGVAMEHSTKERPAMLLIHETGVVAKVHQTGPHTRRVLQHSRHRGLVCVFTMPRVKGVDPLVLAQSDLVYVFELPNPDDRRQLAGIIGWSPADLDAGVAELGRHEYLRFDANQTAPEDGQQDLRLVALPALPEDVVKDVTTWADDVKLPTS